MRRKLSLVERLWRKSVIDPIRGCNLWQGSLCHNGYGEIRDDGKTKRVHRAAFECLIGPIPEGKMICHKCDVRNCWNVEHLFPGTGAENQADCAAKGRAGGPPQIGEKHGNAVLTEVKIRAIRADTRLLREIAVDYGIHFGTVHGIRHRKSWRHVT